MNAASRDRVKARHIKLARWLVDTHSISFRLVTDADLDTVEKLVTSQIDEASRPVLGPDDGCLVAEREGALIGAAVMSVLGFDDGTLMIVRHLAVDPAWHGIGVGSVLVGMLPQVVSGQTAPSLPLLMAGNCDSGLAGFYNAAGFEVLAKGQKLPVPFGKGANLGLTTTRYPHWFYRVT